MHPARVRRILAEMNPKFAINNDDPGMKKTTLTAFYPKPGLQGQSSLLSWQSVYYVASGSLGFVSGMFTTHNAHVRAKAFSSSHMSVYVDESDISKVPGNCGIHRLGIHCFHTCPSMTFFHKEWSRHDLCLSFTMPGIAGQLLFLSRCYDRHVFPFVGSIWFDGLRYWNSGKYRRVLPCFARYFGKIVAKHLADLAPARIPRTWLQHWQLAGASASSSGCGPKQLNFRVVSRQWESTERVFRSKTKIPKMPTGYPRLPIANKKISMD